MSTFRCEVPAGAKPGDTLQMTAPSGAVVQVVVPPGVSPGAHLELQDPGIGSTAGERRPSHRAEERRLTRPEDRKPSGVPAMNKGLSRSGTSTFKERAICIHGSNCYRRNQQHLESHSHPADQDYLFQCRQHGAKPEIISIRRLFDWCDVNGTNKASRDEVSKNWHLFQEIQPRLKKYALDDKMWEQMDDDGNGFVNFGEFAEFTTKHELDLPLGLDSLMAREINSGGEALRCGVLDCFCNEFRPKRRRCKYGEDCYQKAEAHLRTFAHVGDPDWGDAARGRYADSSMCVCGHKEKLHASAKTGAAAFDYPVYWTTKLTESGTDFNKLVSVDAEMLDKLRDLLTATYSDVTTRDRLRHSGTWEVPRGFQLIAAQRNENSKLWRKYCIRKAQLQQEEQKAEIEHLYDDILTTKFWEAASAESLDSEINEWYLFHGSSASAAKNICSNDYKMRLAGSTTGTLYGRGSYFAESITKADEYSKKEGRTFTVLLNRVLGGNVRYCEDREPEADALTTDCVEGPYDCVLGDRKKISGTYREFVVFDTENVYPEYLLTYEREEFFKSPSHP